MRLLIPNISELLKFNYLNDPTLELQEPVDKISKSVTKEFIKKKTKDTFKQSMFYVNIDKNSKVIGSPNIDETEAKQYQILTKTFQDFVLKAYSDSKISPSKSPH